MRAALFPTVGADPGWDQAVGWARRARRLLARRRADAPARAAGGRLWCHCRRCRGWLAPGDGIDELAHRRGAGRPRPAAAALVVPALPRGRRAGLRYPPARSAVPLLARADRRDSAPVLAERA